MNVNVEIYGIHTGADRHITEGGALLTFFLKIKINECDCKKKNKWGAFSKNYTNTSNNTNVVEHKLKCKVYYVRKLHIRIGRKLSILLTLFFLFKLLNQYKSYIFLKILFKYYILLNFSYYLVCNHLLFLAFLNYKIYNNCIFFLREILS